MPKARSGYLIALAIFIADQVTKWIVTGPMGVDRLGDQIVVLPIFNFTYVENYGISLGLFQATSDTMRWVLVGITAAIAAGVAVWITRETNRIDQIGLGMVLGGAIGNILDRARLGYVVDFADLHFGEFRPFYIFNVGDAAISIGVVILLLRAFLTRDTRTESADPEEIQDHA